MIYNIFCTQISNSTQALIELLEGYDQIGYADLIQFLDTGIDTFNRFDLIYIDFNRNKIEEEKGIVFAKNRADVQNKRKLESCKILEHKINSKEMLRYILLDKMQIMSEALLDLFFLEINNYEKLTFFLGENTNMNKIMSADIGTRFNHFVKKHIGTMKNNTVKEVMQTSNFKEQWSYYFSQLSNSFYSSMLFVSALETQKCNVMVSKQIVSNLYDFTKIIDEKFGLLNKFINKADSNKEHEILFKYSLKESPIRRIRTFPEDLFEFQLHKDHPILSKYLSNMLYYENNFFVFKNRNVSFVTAFYTNVLYKIYLEVLPKCMKRILANETESKLLLMQLQEENNGIDVLSLLEQIHSKTFCLSLLWPDHLAHYTKKMDEMSDLWIALFNHSK